MTKVIMRFRDKNTKKVYEKNGVYEGDAKRIDELQKAGYLEKEKPKKNAKSKPKEGE